MRPDSATQSTARPLAASAVGAALVVVLLTAATATVPVAGSLASGSGLASASGPASTTTVASAPSSVASTASRVPVDSGGIEASGIDRATAVDGGAGGVDRLRPAAETGPAIRSRSTALDNHTADTTVTRIRVHPNGSATWTVAVRTRLRNDSDVESYEAFQREFRNDTARYLDPFRERMRRVVARAENVTDREMRAVDFRASTRVESVPRQWGVVAYRLRWEGFAAVDRVDGTRVLRVGDVFQGGYYLAEGDSLVVAVTGDYRRSDVRPAPERGDDRTARWSGPIDFADGRPQVTFRRVEATPTTGTGADGTTGDSGADDSVADDSGVDDSGADGGGIGLLVPLVVVVVLLAGAAGVVVRRNGGIAAVGGEGEGTPGEAESAGTADDAGQTDRSGDSQAAPTGSADGPAGADVPDPDLLTDEERVVRAIERNGGRMRQADVADELDWSASKTSRVLSSMDEDGAVEKIRLGNENVIDLPDGDDGDGAGDRSRDD